MSINKKSDPSWHSRCLISTYLRAHTEDRDGRGNVEISGDGDVGKAGLETLGPDGQPGEGVEVHGGGQAEDDRPVLVHPQAGHRAFLVSNLNTVGTRPASRAHHEESVGLVPTEYQVLDHHSLTVDGHDISTVGPATSESSQDLRLGKIHLDVIWHQDTSNHLLKCDGWWGKNMLQLIDDEIDSLISYLDDKQFYIVVYFVFWDHWAPTFFLLARTPIQSTSYSDFPSGNWRSNCPTWVSRGSTLETLFR